MTEVHIGALDGDIEFIYTEFSDEDSKQQCNWYVPYGQADYLAKTGRRQECDVLDLLFLCFYQMFLRGSNTGNKWLYFLYT